MSPLVSVVIPVYNGQAFLRECLDSVLNQTMDDYEIIVINDGSTDRTGFIIADYQAAYPDVVRAKFQENRGQGTARNRGVQIASGKYILFLDADDLLDPRTLEIVVKRAESAAADVVKFDWKYYYRGARGTVYNNVEPYISEESLIGPECERLLQTNHYFSVTALYLKSFLQDNQIRYGEKYIYEDFVFFVSVATHAQRVEIVSAPLYSVRPHGASTTKTGYATRRHLDGFIHACSDSIDKINESHRSSYAAYYFLTYILTKYFVYYRNRVRGRARREMRRRLLSLMHKCDVVIPPDGRSRVLKFMVKHEIATRQRHGLFRFITVYKSWWTYYFFRARRKRRNLVNRAKRKIRKAMLIRSSKSQNDVDAAYAIPLSKPDAIAYYRTSSLKLAVQHGVILFLGYDHAYAGNSRYLFKELITDQRFKDCKIRFVSDEQVSSDFQKYFVKPWSREHMDLLAEASVMIMESWIPEFIGKRAASVWVQLWHGTPLKKVLFDSSEPEIVTLRPRHKVAKYRDTKRWDVLIADSKWAERSMGSGFMVPPEKILLSGYPRVRWLIENHDDAHKMLSIKKRLGFSDQMLDKTVVLYAPTWRDYNYGVDPDEMDLAYAADTLGVLQKLDERFIVLTKGHSYMESTSTSSSEVISADELESQEALLIADHVVSDYSSIVFDALAIGTRVSIFALDFDKYAKVRGVYETVWSDLEPLICQTEGELLSGLQDFDVHPAPNEDFNDYVYKNEVDLADWLANVMEATGPFLETFASRRR